MRFRNHGNDVCKTPSSDGPVQASTHEIKKTCQNIIARGDEYLGNIFVFLIDIFVYLIVPFRCFELL